MGLITETNQQYYAGSQGFRGNAANTINQKFTTTFDTDVILGSTTSWNPTDANYVTNNFKLYVSSTGTPGTWSEWITEIKIDNNIIELVAAPGANVYIVVQLKSLNGGKYGSTDIEKAFGQVVEDNYGEYSYTKLGDIIDNYMVGYVGDGKIIQTAKKSDVLFFAKRSLQEFSYDTLKVIKSQELTIPPSLSLAIPQDYVNYVKLSWIDNAGAKHIIYPTRVTSNPSELPIQDNTGQPTQDQAGANLLSQQSLTEERWKSQDQTNNWRPDDYRYPFNEGLIGQRYGLQPEEAQVNGKFTINERTGTFSFSSDLAGKLIILEYISDNLAYDADMKVPKMAEEAMYMHIAYSILSGRSGVPEYIVNRFKRDRSSALRNAKIRLSNIKIEEIAQVFRNKSKWIKH